MVCCSPGPDSCAGPAAAKLPPCPRCGHGGKPVTTLTVKSLVRDHTRVSVQERYWFCRAPDCDVVYFSGSGIFRKPDVKVRVGLKEQEDPVPLCYCFDYTRENVWRDLEKSGHTDIPARIKAEVQAGFCACKVKNPSGTCCLGEIHRAIQEAKRRSQMAIRKTPAATSAAPSQRRGLTRSLSRYLARTVSNT